ncbi:MAG: TRAP transporter small permease [Gammaproteobacteria bacterium]
MPARQSVVSSSARLSRWLMILAAAWAFVLTFIIVADIVARNAFNHPVPGVREIVANSIVMIVFLQAGYAIRSRSMLRAEFLVEAFPLALRRFALAFGYLAGAGFFLIVIAGGWDLAIHSWQAGEYEGEGALRVPSWPARFIVLIGAALACVNYLVMAWLDVFRPETSEAQRNASSYPKA